MQACAIISLLAFGAGLISNVVVLFSLPFIPDASVYIASINYVSPESDNATTDPLAGNGTLNNNFPFHNLSSFRVSLCVLLNYDRFDLFFGPVG
jgi:hypothetical protein